MLLFISFSPIFDKREETPDQDVNYELIIPSQINEKN